MSPAKGSLGTEPFAEAALPKLTKRFVDSLAPESADTLYRASELPGFA
jgi:hypothetical protein